MEIQETRLKAHMSQRTFSQHFGIPLGTLRNWEQGISKPPDYVFNMIITSLRRDKMINIETMKFMKMLDELAIQSAVGIKDFSEATEATAHEMVFYDKSSPDPDGHYPVVLESCVIDNPKCIHHDIIKYYDSDTSEYVVQVELGENGQPFIHVAFVASNEDIVVEEGKWYFV